MSFIDALPNELILMIVHHSMPESFTALALSCKHIHGICAPLVAHHNRLVKAFRDFRYHRNDLPDLGYASIDSAFDLIASIAKEPLIGRYIQMADFSEDGCLIGASDNDSEQADKGAVLELLANSEYLRQAGIDHSEYYGLLRRVVDPEHPSHSIDVSWNQQGRPPRSYSQDAAAFLLTLLPNLIKLQLPRSWSSTPESDKLIAALTNKSRSLCAFDVPSLGITRSLISNYDREYQRQDSKSAFEQISALLTLPYVEELRASKYSIQGNIVLRSTPYLNIKSIRLELCHFHNIGLMDILQATPNITSLHYCYARMPHEYVLQLIKAIVRSQTAPNLEYLAFQPSGVSGEYDQSREPVELSGKCRINHRPRGLKMREFLRLQRFMFPLELLSEAEDISCEFHEATSLPRIVELPPSLLSIAIAFDGTSLHKSAFKNLLKHLISGVANHQLQLRTLTVWTRSQIHAESDLQFASQVDDLRNLGVDIKWIY